MKVQELLPTASSVSSLRSLSSNEMAPVLAQASGMPYQNTLLIQRYDDGLILTEGVGVRNIDRRFRVPSGRWDGSRRAGSEVRTTPWCKGRFADDPAARRRRTKR